MNTLPTVDECNTWILEQCQILLSDIESGNFDIKETAQTTYDSTKILINALDITRKEKTKLLNKLERYSRFKQNNNMMKLLILNIKDICCQVIKTRKERAYLSVTTSNNFLREEERILSSNQTSCKVDYNFIWPDQIDEKACWFRNYFVGKQYVTYIGPIMENEKDFALISVVKEYEKELNQKPFLQYRIIVRTKQDINMGFIVHESDAKELILQIEESVGHYNKLDVENETKRHRPLRSFSSAIIIGMSNNQYQQQQQQSHHSTRIMRAAILFLFQDINFRLFKELSAETTILAGLEKEFLRYDEIGIPKNYKFGVLTIKDDQDTEEAWFSNSGLSIGLEKLLDIIGRPIELKDYKGYAAGLDTKTGESGDISYVSSWRDHEIMFHVAPLMPSRDQDIQQIHRKRYIGNDIVCIVFMEGKNQKFDPDSIRSQFLHVFIIVHLQVINHQDIWRVEVLHNRNVKPFSPHIPSPPIFYNQDDLRNFLILKLINAENASLKAEKFTLPNNKARQSILKTLIDIGLEASQVARSFGANHSRLNGEKKYHPSGVVNGERPKSAGAQQQHISSVRSSFKSNNTNNNNINNNILVESSRSITPELPPIPSISRSSVLRDLKSLTRRKSGITNPRLPNQNTYNMSTNTMVSRQQYQRPLLHKPNDIASDEKEGTNNIRNRRVSCINHYQAERKHMLEPLCEMSTSTMSVSSTTTPGSGIRYKAHNLMNTMIGRRNSRTGLPHSS